MPPVLPRTAVFSAVFRVAVVWFTLTALAHVATVRFHLTQHIAQALGATLRAMHVPAAVSGSNVIIERFTVEIIEECTGLSLAAALVAFALAVPVPWKTRLAGAALLFAVAEAWNAVRLVALALIGWRWPRSIHFVHDVIWQIATVALVIAVAVVWTRRVTRVRA